MGVTGQCHMGLPWGHRAQNLRAGTLRTGLQGSGSRGKVGGMLSEQLRALASYEQPLQVVMFFKYTHLGSQNAFLGRRGTAERAGINTEDSKLTWVILDLNDVQKPNPALQSIVSSSLDPSCYFRVRRAEGHSKWGQ